MPINGERQTERFKVKGKTGGERQREIKKERKQEEGEMVKESKRAGRRKREIPSKFRCGN